MEECRVLHTDSHICALQLSIVHVRTQQHLAKLSPLILMLRCFLFDCLFLVLMSLEFTISGEKTEDVSRGPAFRQTKLTINYLFSFKFFFIPRMHSCVCVCVCIKISTHNGREGATLNESSQFTVECSFLHVRVVCVYVCRRITCHRHRQFTVE